MDRYASPYVMLPRFGRNVSLQRYDGVDAMTREIRLPGGLMQKVVRVGDTVRRAPRGNIEFIRELLGNLEAAGFMEVPRWLGTDEKGREILSYVEGKVPRRFGHFDDATLCEAARFIRRYHDATSRFFEGGRVACHNDLSPCNFAFRDGVPSAIIDFDNAAEGERIFDLAFAAWTWLNLGSKHASEEQLRRLRLFAQAYGSEIELGALIDTILLRQKLLIEAPLPWRFRFQIRSWARRGREATLRIRDRL
jgi:hypothetical protein